jgi:hypothetical protein
MYSKKIRYPFEISLIFLEYMLFAEQKTPYRRGHLRSALLKYPNLKKNIV